MDSKMDCKTAERCMTARIDGELDAERVRALDAHIVECAACALRWQEDQQIRSLVRAAGEAYARDQRPVVGSGRILLDERRRRTEELAAVGLLRRLAAAAAVVLMGTGILVATSIDRAVPDSSPTSLRAVAVESTASSMDGLIHADNTILLALSGSWGTRT